MRSLRSGLAALAVLFSFAGSAFAQVPLSPTQRPTVSPYINLARPGTNPAIEYYGNVRPQLDFRQGITGLQQQVGANELAIGAATDPRTVPPTGVGANFNTQARYFMTRGSRSLTQTPSRPAGSFAPQAPGRGQLQSQPGR